MKMNIESDNCAWNSTRSSCHLNTLKPMNQHVDTSELTYDEVEQTLKFSMNIYFSSASLFFSRNSYLCIRIIVVCL